MTEAKSQPQRVALADTGLDLGGLVGFIQKGAWAEYVGQEADDPYSSFFVNRRTNQIAAIVLHEDGMFEVAISGVEEPKARAPKATSQAAFDFNDAEPAPSPAAVKGESFVTFLEEIYADPDLAQFVAPEMRIAAPADPVPVAA